MWLLKVEMPTGVSGRIMWKFYSVAQALFLEHQENGCWLKQWINAHEFSFPSYSQLAAMKQISTCGLATFPRGSCSSSPFWVQDPRQFLSSPRCYLGPNRQLSGQLRTPLEVYTMLLCQVWETEDTVLTNLFCITYNKTQYENLDLYRW